MLFYYFGDDEAYFRTLSAEFQKHTRIRMIFKRIYESDEKKIQTLFFKVVMDKPSCIFFDFSKQTQDYLHLACIVSRTSRDHELVTVGLIDYLSPPEVIMDSISTGVDFTHIKSSESFDVVFDVSKLIAPKETSEHSFATATLSEEWVGGIAAKVGYVHREGFHLETNHELQAGEKIQVSHGWNDKTTIPSKWVQVKEVFTSSLCYNYKFAADLNFIFVDECISPPDMEPSLVLKKNSEREELIFYHRKQFNRWIDDNISRSIEKKTKVLVVDEKFHFYNDRPRTDKYAFMFRSLSSLGEISLEIPHLKPHVIAFDMQECGEVAVRELIAILKVNKENPFLIVFNYPMPSKELQDALDYRQLMTIKTDFSVETIVQMANILEKKKNAEAQVKDTQDARVYLKKTNPSSTAEILIAVKVTKLSETDLVFKTEKVLPVGMNIHFKTPVEMFVYILGIKKENSLYEYYSLVHCIGETNKKELRRYVNSVFFRGHDAQVNDEAVQFQKLNEAKLLEKEALAKALKEDIKPQEILSDDSPKETKT